MARLCLGSVNFGMQYGPKNYKVPKDEVFKILQVAKQYYIDLDTAMAYGNAEKLIGEGPKNDVITKLLPNCLPNDIDCYNMVFALVETSMNRLNTEKLYGLLLHNENHIYHLGAIHSLVNMKKTGMVENIGISVYDPEIAIQAAKTNFDIIQIPFSVFDQQLIDTEFFDIAKDNNIEVYARSSFLQGVLSMEIDKIPENTEKIPNLKELLQKYEKIVNNYGFTRSEASLLFSLTQPGIDYVVIGVDSVQQLHENIRLNNPDIIDSFQMVREELLWEFSGMGLQIPSLWGKK